MEFQFKQDVVATLIQELMAIDSPSGYTQNAIAYIENKAKSTSGVNNINSDEISQLPIPLFSHQEQVAIIDEIESRLSVCDSIEQTVDAVLAQAEALRQSILKKAFEGGFSQ